MNALQTAVAQLKADFADLKSVVASSTFTADDVASITTLDADVKALKDSLSPPVSGATDAPTPEDDAKS